MLSISSFLPRLFHYNSTSNLNKNNSQNFNSESTSFPPPSANVNLDRQGINFFLNSFIFPKKNLSYKNILEKLENSKLIYFNKEKQKIISALTLRANFSSAKESDKKNYLLEIENTLINFWSEIAIKTDGFKNPIEYKSIKLTDNEIEVWLDLKKFVNTVMKEFLLLFLPDQADKLLLILESLTVRQLADLSVDLKIEEGKEAVIPISPSQDTISYIDRAIYQEIEKRLLNSLQQAKNTLYHPGLLFLDKQNLLFWQNTLATSALNQIQQFTKTTETWRTLTRYIGVSSSVQTAIDSLYEHLLTDLKKHESHLNLQALQELKCALSILKEFSSVTFELKLQFNQQMINCWRSLCERMADHFHHTLIPATNSKDIIYSVYQLLIAYTELNATSDATAKPPYLKEFIKCSIEKLDENKRNRLAYTLSTEPIAQLTQTLSNALNNSNRYLSQHPIQRATIAKIFKCFYISSDSQPQAPASFSHTPRNTSTPASVDDYLSQIQKIFKIEIPTLAEQKQGKPGRVLRGNVSANFSEIIQNRLQGILAEGHASEEFMRDCRVASTFVTDASRGSRSIIRNSAFNGKRVFDEFKEYKDGEMERIFVTLLKNFCGSDKLMDTASLYVSQTPYNLIDNIVTNQVITLPAGKPIIALTSTGYSMKCNLLSLEPSKSVRMEIAFERTGIDNALTLDDLEPLPLNPASYLHWKTTLEINQREQPHGQMGQEIKLVSPIAYEYSLIPKTPVPPPTPKALASYVLRGFSIEE